MRLDELTAAERREIRRGHYTPGPVRAPSVRGAANVPDQRSPAPDGLFACHHCHETFRQYAPAERHARTSRHYRIDTNLQRIRP